MAQANRRSFLKSAALSSAALAVPAFRKDAQSPNEKFRVACMGVRGRGGGLLYGFADLKDVEVTHVCDVDTRVFDEKLKKTEEIQGKRPKTETDFRRLLDDPSIDAIVMGTPTHWHAIPTILACQAGKHVYVEKPASHNMKEGRAMVEAARKYDRVVQVGIQSRNGRFFQQAIDYIRSGVLGKVRFAKGWESAHNRNLGFPADTAPPAGVDYDMWLGPAKKRPFNKHRFHWDFRWYWDYAGGLMTDWGVHLIDIVLMGMKATAPRSVMSLGGPFGYPDSAMETPDTQQAIYEYDDFTMTWEHSVGISLGPHQRGHGVSFTGNNGTLVIDRGGWEVLAETGRRDGERYEKTPAIERRTAAPDQRGLAQHTRNFIDCMRTREQPRCNADVGALVAVNAHLGNIAFRTGRRVYWDHAAGRVKGDEEANALLRAEYHNGWQFPRVTDTEASAV